jgi:hypothetical protein
VTLMVNLEMQIYLLIFRTKLNNAERVISAPES